MNAPESELRTDAIPTREEALRRLTAFVPHAGRAYAAQRNYDRGPADRSNVSMLSPYVRHRVLLEEEVLRAVLARHTPSEAFKFVQEVFWRTYWKGRLESEPEVWSRYRLALDERFAELARDPRLAGRYDDATSARTANEAFDAWVRELRAYGYLHNHARMWFASTWIFTLGLPWELGADFFMQHLLDGDAASNTLSWRWVAGLHTRGKTYRATRDNIRRYTEGRLDPGFALAAHAPPLRESAPPLGEPALASETCGQPATYDRGVSEAASLLVLHDDDFGGESLALAPGSVRAVCAIVAAGNRSPRGVADAARTFATGLARDALTRAVAQYGARDGGVWYEFEPAAVAAQVRQVAREHGASHVVAPFAPVGPVRGALRALRSATTDSPGTPGTPGTLVYRERQRAYDALAWPHATRGFFGLATKIPDILEKLSLR